MLEKALTLAPALMAAALALSADWAVAGPVVYNTQARRIGASLSERSSGTDASASDNESAVAPDLGNWDATVTAAIDNPPPELSGGSASVSQHSTLTDAGVSATGTAGGRTGSDEGSYGVSSRLDVTFTLDDARRFDFEYRFGVATLVDSTANLVLTRLTDNVTVFDEQPDFFNIIDDANGLRTAGSRRGSLEPGQYRFRFDYSAGGDVGASLPYAVSLALEADDGPTPEPIPLPPAAWSGLLGAAFAFGGSRLARLTRHRAS
jgi:hypothetical protein